MRRRFRYALLAMSFTLCFATVAFGQRTTGDIEGKVTDTNGAVVPGVSITVTGITVGFSRTIQSDSQGEFRVQQIPPGVYIITTGATSGFAAATVSDVTVTIEKATTVNIKLGLSTTAESVVVTSDALGVNVDTSDSKVQTNITQKLIDQLPNGTSFTSLLKISPATRQENRSGGFQVDGASGAENAFLIDGMSLENFRTGTLNGVNNIPTALVSEIQIKTGGFEAEHGGASGGVISVVTKSGSDEFHGELGSDFELSGLQPNPRFNLQRFVSDSGTQAAILNNPDFLFTLPQTKDKSANFFPTATLGGPAIKGRLWFLGSYSPQMFRTTRVSNFINATSNSNFSTGIFVPSPRLAAGSTTPLPALTYKRNIKSEYAFGRLDGAILNNLRGSVTYLWNPEITDGNLPFDSVTTSIPVNVNYAGFSFPSDQYARLRGGRTSSNNVTSQLSWTPSSKMVATFRYGRAFQNQKGDNYGLSAVPRNRCQGSQSAYTRIATGCLRGFENVTTNSITIRDVSIRNEYNGDVSYILSEFGGNHEFKGGYQYGRTSNDVLNGNTDTGTISLFYGQDYAGAGTGVSLPCALGTASCIGVGTYSRSGSKGVAQNNYQAIYIQDRWRPVSRLALNLGIRFEKENLPSYNEAFTIAGSDVPPIRLGWGKKVAPRLGGAYDLLGDGKTKIYASYGWFYDRLRFQLPRGLFGGDFFRTDYFPITADHPNFDFYTPERILGNWTDPVGGGNPSTVGGLSQLQRDFRIPSNLNPEQFANLGLPVTGVDPDLKPFRQSEITVGFERELTRSYVLSVRYTRKNVDNAIEDHAILGLDESENYPIGNPGEGLDLKLDRETGYVKSAKPQRLYNAVEVVLNKRLASNYFFNLNYTYGRLYGNYSGLASSDEITNGNGRTSPSVNRFFDYAVNGFTATGEPDNGFLATDRRHAFKAYGGYSFNKWMGDNHATDLSFFYTALQGTPMTTFVSVAASSIVLSKRGDLGRTPVLTQTDLSLTHRFKVKERFSLAFDFNVFNVFNQNTVISLVTNKYRVTNTIAAIDIDPTYDSHTQTLTNVFNKILNGQAGPQIDGLASGANRSIQGAPGTGTNGRTNPISSLYGQPNGYQDGRNVRFGIRFTF
jgi:Carboxypeptidase regulatory-like domain/TonB dependent receptor/TonB-dependent Receptor Plug Domain